jgi:hypothetical protein
MVAKPPRAFARSAELKFLESEDKMGLIYRTKEEVAKAQQEYKKKTGKSPKIESGFWLDIPPKKKKK